MTQIPPEEVLHLETNSQNPVPKMIWPNSYPDSPWLGLSDQNIELICREKTNPNFPYLFWTSEIYGFGRCFRNWLSWPRWLPIPFYSDHGVCFNGFLEDHEINSPSLYHATWFDARYDALTREGKKRILHLPHPWPLYRRERKYDLLVSRQGTLIFIPHSNHGIDHKEYDYDSYFDQIKQLGAKYEPFVLCIQAHDVKKGLHKKLRKYGFPIVTVGNSSDPAFVDRFYRIVRNFEYATSSKVGSQLFYCYEMGVKYFLYGEKLETHNTCVDLLAVDSVDACFEEFSKLNSFDDKYRQQLVARILGLTVDDEVAKIELKKIMISELVRLTPYYISNTLFDAVSYFKRSSASSFLSKVFSDIKLWALRH